MEEVEVREPSWPPESLTCNVESCGFPPNPARLAGGPVREGVVDLVLGTDVPRGAGAITPLRRGGQE